LGVVVLELEPPTALPPLPLELPERLDELVVLLETPAVPPPLLLPIEELFGFFGPGLVALGVCLAGAIDVVVGVPAPPPQALSSAAVARDPARTEMGLLMGMVSL
jgi:hypothetical protein